MDPISIKDKLNSFSEQWTPKLIAEMDDYHVKLSKLEGDFVFHAHENVDELFYVVKGRFRMDYRDRNVWIEEGELVVVPKGVEHKPYAEEECSVMFIEKAGTDHTGGVDDPRHIDAPERI